MTTLKGGLIIFGLFIMATLLMVWDPANLNPNGLNGENLEPLLYVIPSIIAGLFIYWQSNKKY